MPLSVHQDKVGIFVAAKACELRSVAVVWHYGQKLNVDNVYAKAWIGNGSSASENVIVRERAHPNSPSRRSAVVDN